MSEPVRPALTPDELREHIERNPDATYTLTMPDGTRHEVKAKNLPPRTPDEI